jgi:uncharacterized protein (DUF1778 family)
MNPVEFDEIEVLERRVVTIPAKDWEAFERWMKQPPQEIPALRALASNRTAWEK